MNDKSAQVLKHDDDNLFETAQRLSAELATAKADVVRLRGALAELVDIVDGVVNDGDKVDSFTLQPARIALSTTSASYADLAQEGKKSP